VLSNILNNYKPNQDQNEENFSLSIIVGGAIPKELSKLT
jgi:hypothetical protein